MKKRILSLLLALVMLLALAACGGGGETQESANPGSSSTPTDSGNDAPTIPNRVILGSTTEMMGDFRYPSWGGGSVNAADNDVLGLVTGYDIQEVNQGGAPVWNETSVKAHSDTENDDGTYTIHIELNEGLTFSDGTPITAQNYLATSLAFSTKVAVAAGLPGTYLDAFVGYADFNAYTGPDSTEGTKEFSGIRMLDDYTFEVTVSSDYYPYYFAYTYAGFSAFPMGLFTGEGVTIQDDGNGCYLSDNFYEKSGDEYVVAGQIVGNRYDKFTYPYSGAYVVSDWDEGTKTVTLTLNPLYKGNFEGQKPSIETIVYTKTIQETELDTLKAGGVDIVSGLADGEQIKAALEFVDDVSFSEVHYQRAGYGMIQFECDFGPTSFTEVRQAVAYLLDRVQFCQTFTGGYGVVIDGPYSPDLDMWQAVRDDIDLTDYAYSPATAVKVLEEGGWIYNSKGEPFESGASGVDAVRYKKLTEEEANATDIFGNDAGNKTYKSVANTDGVEYKTVEINGEYYMPLVINWFGSEGNTVTDLLTTTLANSTALAEAGMVIRPTQGDFTVLLGNMYREASMGYLGTPTYGMLNLASNFSSAIYAQQHWWSPDPAWADYSDSKVKDPYDLAFPYDISAEKLSLDEAMAQSGGKLGMDYLSMGMVYNAETVDDYNAWWQAFIERWNQLMPCIPLYSNMYYDVYNSNIENFETTPFFNPANAILYANIKGY